MTDAPQDEDEEHRRIRRIKNAKRAKRRWNVEARARNPPHRRNLNDAFATAENIAEAALLIQWLPQNPETERLLQLTQRAIVQLDQRDPMPSLQRTRSRSGRHESSIPQVSRTLGGAPIPRGNHNRHHNQDNRSGHGHQHAQQFARGHADQEVQQPP
jgi:hypothetical protein